MKRKCINSYAPSIIYSLEKSSTFSSLLTSGSRRFGSTKFMVILLPLNRLFMKGALPYSRVTSSPVTRNPNVMHTLNGENGTKNSLILKDWSAIHHLLISFRKTTDETCSGWSRRKSHLNWVVSINSLWIGDIWWLMSIIASVWSLCLTLNC